MEKKFFISEAFDVALNEYKKDKTTLILPTENLLLIVKILTLIYGETSIMNSYTLNDANLLAKTLKQYGATDKKLYELFTDINSLYEEIKNKKEGKTFLVTQVQKDLIDLIYLKNPELTEEERQEYSKCLFIKENPNPHFKLHSKFNFILPDEINIHWYKKFKFEEPKIVENKSKKIISVLNNNDNDESGEVEGGRTKTLEEGRKLVLNLPKAGFTTSMSMAYSVIVLMIASIFFLIFLLAR